MLCVLHTVYYYKQKLCAAIFLLSISEGNITMAGKGGTNVLMASWCGFKSAQQQFYLR